MANEITVSVQFSATKGGLKVSKDDAATFDMSGNNYAAGAPTIGTTEEALQMQDVATAGWAYFKNLDGSNYIEIGRVDGGTFRAVAKLKPGEAQSFRLATNTPYAKANTAPCVLDYLILAD
jgi:hypothetical protein